MNRRTFLVGSALGMLSHSVKGAVARSATSGQPLFSSDIATNRVMVGHSKNRSHKLVVLVDEYDSVLAAYNALPERGGTLLFGPGIYEDTGIVATKPLVVRGAGPHATTWRMTTNDIMLDVQGVSITVENMTLDGNKAVRSYSTGILASGGARGIHIRGCRFINMADNALSLDVTSNVWIDGNEFVDCNVTGVRLLPNTGTNANRYIWVVNNWFSNINISETNGHSAVHSHGGSSDIDHEHIFVLNNVVENSRGIGMGLDQIRHGWISGNRLIEGPLSSTGEGIAFTGDDVRVENNDVSGYYSSGIMWFVEPWATHRVAIRENRCWDNLHQGISVVFDANNLKVDGLVVEGNRCWNTLMGPKQSFGFQTYNSPGVTGSAWTNVQLGPNHFSGNAVREYELLPGLDDIGINAQRQATWTSKSHTA